MGEAKRPSRLLGRRRRANSEGGKEHRHVVKVTPEEEALLAQRASAQDVTIARYLVEAGLAEVPGDSSTNRKSDIATLFAINRGFAALGNNLNQIAKATNAGRELPPELRAPLFEILEILKRESEGIDQVIERLLK